jgi:hypothetical protein
MNPPPALESIVPVTARLPLDPFKLAISVAPPYHLKDDEAPALIDCHSVWPVSLVPIAVSTFPPARSGKNTNFVPELLTVVVGTPWPLVFHDIKLPLFPLRLKFVFEGH